MVACATFMRRFPYLIQKNIIKGKKVWLHWGSSVASKQQPRSCIGIAGSCVSIVEGASCGQAVATEISGQQHRSCNWAASKHIQRNEGLKGGFRSRQ
ncbi:hypothetical protein EUGRSUZ_A00270 [Eucalyptus grandis]|uniref:Uncharacterized protein n=2 Tax=Eucalyptus grandis TaxID=71139 RepID=A0ACC3LZX2_EUCGR|nr:hypothetical protein EUGRSUZ_A00270 [Eucalyptus grandis]